MSCSLHRLGVNISICVLLDRGNCLVHVPLVIFIRKYVERLMAPFFVSKMCEHAPWL